MDEIESLKIQVEKLKNLLNIYMHDKLTGLLMRRDFDHKFTEFFNSGKKFYLTLVDVNGLHNVNRDPNQGYDAGDDLIVSISHKLTMICDNVVYRIGGDEFAVLSYNKPKITPDKLYSYAYMSNENFINTRHMMKSADKKIIEAKKILYTGSNNRRQ